MHDIIILGSGPAGLTAALYGARGAKKTLVLGGDQLGGQMATIHSLENYPGTPAVNGAELAEVMKKQAEAFGAEFIFAEAGKIEIREPKAESEGSVPGPRFSVVDKNGKEYESRSVIIATGAKPRPLAVTGIREFMGRGVSYCATCDGFFYSGKDVIVVGGGNAALNDALYLADLARSVKILYRKDRFSRGEQVLVDRVNAKENIRVMFNTEVAEVGGGAAGVEYAVTAAGEKIPVDGVFIAIGHEANTDYLSEDIKRDNMGRLSPAALPAGLFVAGDVQSDLKMQVATAVGAGCAAAMDAIVFLNKAVSG
ncbi:MAG: FAD-dependent oxidoreductase [Proteobacteria bacterium]|nr:FAD-dependent oxidoreductase [Pseudomonadota bacterium]